MLISRVSAVISVAAVLLGVTACAGSSNDSAHARSTGSSVLQGSATHPSGSISADPSFVTGGAALADSAHLIFVLEAVNPKIGTDEKDLIAKSKALCAHINTNESEGQLETDASSGFTNGAWVPSQAEAQAIVGTVKAYGGC